MFEGHPSGFRQLLFMTLLLGSGTCFLTGSAFESRVIPQRLQNHRSFVPVNLRAIGRAILDYHRDHGHFPPSVRRDRNGNLHSWRTSILPYLPRTSFRSTYRFQEKWNSPHNVTAAKRMPSIFPQYGPGLFQAWGKERHSTLETNFVAVTGSETVWSSDEHVSFSQLSNPSQTILLIEVEQSGIHWTEPRDPTFESLDFRINHSKSNAPGSADSAGVYALFADGSVRFLKADQYSVEELRKMFLIEK